MDPDKGDGEQLGWQLVGQVGARIVPRQRRGKIMYILEKILTMVSTESSSFCKKMVSTESSSFLQNFIWEDNLCTENCLSWGKTSVFPQLCSKSKEHEG
jgi:hypothetical protein